MNSSLSDYQLKICYKDVFCKPHGKHKAKICSGYTKVKGKGINITTEDHQIDHNRAREKKETGNYKTVKN